MSQHSTTYPSLAPPIMKTPLLALVSTGESRGTREGAIWGLVGVGKEAIRKGLIEGHGAEGVAQGSQIPGCSSLAETVMVRIGFFSTCACLLTWRCAIPGRVFHTVPLIEVTCTFKPCTLRSSEDFEKPSVISSRRGWYTTLPGREGFWANLPTTCSSERGIIVSTLPRMRDHALVFTIFVRALYCFPISFGARVL